MAKKYTGYTAETPKHFVLDAGVFFKNYDSTTDTVATAIAAGKCIGATQGGGEFSYVPEIRQIEIDGMPKRFVGSEVFDDFEVYLKCSVVEVTADVLKDALTCGKKTGNKVEITGDITTTDYIDNVTWVGRMSDTGKEIIITINNALHTEGLTISPNDKAEAVVDLTYYGHDDGTNPVFTIEIK